jgi:hypothetical protein
MSTVKKPLKYLWNAYFHDGYIIMQPPDDRYSKHDDNAEWNPSSFRDILEYGGELTLFTLCDARRNVVAAVNLKDGTIQHLGKQVHSTASTEPKKLVYYREVDVDYVDGVFSDSNIAAYCVGYEYKNKDGKNIQRIIRIDG